MKKLSIVSIALFISFAAFSQADTSLNRRLQEYTRLSKELNFAELMDYIHPGLFAVTPKDQMIELFESAYNNAEMSIAIVNIENRKMSEPFTVKDAQYRKVDYYVELHMKFKDESKLDSNFVTRMTGSLQEAVPGKEVGFDQAGKYFVLKGMDILMAIRDNPQAKWFFLGYQPGNEMAKTLFPKEVLEHFKLQ